jgi:hypothetical protein
MISRPAERHNGEKRSIHYCKSDVPELVTCFAQDDLT